MLLRLFLSLSLALSFSTDAGFRQSPQFQWSKSFYTLNFPSTDPAYAPRYEKLKKFIEADDYSKITKARDEQDTSALGSEPVPVPAGSSDSGSGPAQGASPASEAQQRKVK
jgi:hypothetical protein